MRDIFDGHWWKHAEDGNYTVCGRCRAVQGQEQNPCPGSSDDASGEYEDVETELVRAGYRLFYAYARHHAQAGYPHFPAACIFCGWENAVMKATKNAADTPPGQLRLRGSSDNEERDA